ncbi:MAG: AAA family ATPase [Candidatus Hodarchaeota archaeon]
MELKSVEVTNFKSIEKSGSIPVNQVTCLVGKNESGKTAFLQALYKLNPIIEDKYDPTMEYPRRYLAKYRRKEKKDNTVISAEFALGDSDVEDFERQFNTSIDDNKVRVLNGYYNQMVFYYKIDEKKILQYISGWDEFPSSLIEKINGCENVEEFIKIVKDLNEENKFLVFLEKLESNFGNLEEKMDIFFSRRIPKFLFFSDYYIMKGRISLEQFLNKKNNNTLNEADETFLSLLNMAQTDIDEILSAKKYEELKATLEACSIEITDQVFEYWSQNKDLSVEIEVSPGKEGDDPPFNKGTIVHIRIKNTRHRVTVPFDERSKGFIWFFSFLAYFSQFRDKERLILLMDEPGLSLHAKAQNDFLRFIYDQLSTNHQVIYTTHSPFMIEPNRFEDVRTVEDKDKERTVVSDQIYNTGKDTIFPLQSALGYDLAQTLFVGPNCLLVEGPSDLIYLNIISDVLGDEDGLDSKWTITPVGGADKIGTFISLICSNQLNFAILRDFGPGDQKKINELIKNQNVKDKQIFVLHNYTSKKFSDIEDLFEESFYIDLINKTFKYEPEWKLSDLKGKDGIMKRIERKLGSRPSHLRPATYLLKNPNLWEKITDQTLERFKKLFTDINKLII